MATRFSPQRRSFAPKSAYRRPASPHRLSAGVMPSAVVDAVLRFHDEACDQGAGRTLLSLSADRLHQPAVEAALGGHAGRAAKVSILWSERESQIIRVMEAA